MFKYFLINYSIKYLTVTFSPLIFSSSQSLPMARVLVTVLYGRTLDIIILSPLLLISVTTFTLRPFSIYSSGTPTGKNNFCLFNLSTIYFFVWLYFFINISRVKTIIKLILLSTKFCYLNKNIVFAWIDVLTWKIIR